MPIISVRDHGNSGWKRNSKKNKTKKQNKKKQRQKRTRGMEAIVKG